MKKTNKYHVLSIAKTQLIKNYPKKYQADTIQYPVFQDYLDGEDDKIFIVHESDINNIECELDFIEPEGFFAFGDVSDFIVTTIESDETADVWLDHRNGLPVGSTRDDRLKRK